MVTHPAKLCQQDFESEQERKCIVFLSWFSVCWLKLSALNCPNHKVDSHHSCCSAHPHLPWQVVSFSSPSKARISLYLG